MAETIRSSKPCIPLRVRLDPASTHEIVTGRYVEEVYIYPYGMQGLCTGALATANAVLYRELAEFPEIATKPYARPARNDNDRMLQQIWNDRVPLAQERRPKLLWQVALNRSAREKLVETQEGDIVRFVQHADEVVTGLEIGLKETLRMGRLSREYTDGLFIPLDKVTLTFPEGMRVVTLDPTPPPEYIDQ